MCWAILGCRREAVDRVEVSDHGDGFGRVRISQNPCSAPNPRILNRVAAPWVGFVVEQVREALVLLVRAGDEEARCYSDVRPDAGLRFRAPSVATEVDFADEALELPRLAFDDVAEGVGAGDDARERREIFGDCPEAVDRSFRR